MSQENVEIVMEGVRAWNRNDLEAMVALAHPDVVVVPPEGWPEAETYTTPEATLRQVERLKGSWEEERVEIDDVQSVGDKVVVETRWIAKGQGSGIEVEAYGAGVFTIRDGKIIRWEAFLEKQRALEAAGLSE
jgi:ketosteroid isomerase-like protein